MVTNVNSIKKKVLEMILETSKSLHPEVFIGRLRVKEGAISELIFIPESKDVVTHPTLPSAVGLSLTPYGPYTIDMLVKPDFVMDFSVVGFVISHTTKDIKANEQDLKLFGTRGNTHIIAAWPFDHDSWRAYDRTGKVKEIEVV